MSKPQVYVIVDTAEQAAVLQSVAYAADIIRERQKEIEWRLQRNAEWLAQGASLTGTDGGAMQQYVAAAAEYQAYARMASMLGVSDEDTAAAANGAPAVVRSEAVAAGFLEA